MVMIRPSKRVPRFYSHARYAIVTRQGFLLAKGNLHKTTDNSVYAKLYARKVVAEREALRVGGSVVEVLVAAMEDFATTGQAVGSDLEGD